MTIPAARLFLSTHLDGAVGELWVSLMEKAYAKLHGCFFALDGGSIGDALVDLTGGVLSKLKLDSDEGEGLVDGGALWNRLEMYCSWGYVMCAMHKVKPAAENATGPGGLLLNYTYNIVDCCRLSDGAQLICMHNPWPSGKWHGAWGQQSREWKNLGVLQRFRLKVYLEGRPPADQICRSDLHDHARAALFNASCAELQDELKKLRSLHTEDGAFWISYTDFTRAFNRLYVTQLFPPTWHQLTLHSGVHIDTIAPTFWQSPCPRFRHWAIYFVLTFTSSHWTSLQDGTDALPVAQCMCKDDQTQRGVATHNSESQLDRQESSCCVSASKTL